MRRARTCILLLPIRGLHAPTSGNLAPALARRGFSILLPAVPSGQRGTAFYTSLTLFSVLTQLHLAG